MTFCKNIKPFNSQNDYNNGSAALVFDTMNHDFGTVVAGTKVTYTFTFHNPGTGNLLISDVKPGCGCTVSKFRKEAIPPGGDGSIEIVFDSSDLYGYQLKTVDVVSNALRKVLILKISAEVISK